MSDSDETDVLLLIPPDFFNCESSAVLTPRTPANCSFDFADCLSYASFAQRSNVKSMAGIGNYSVVGCTAAERTEHYVASTPFKHHAHKEPLKEQYLLHEIDRFLQEDDPQRAQQRQQTRANQHNRPGQSPDGSLIDVDSLSVQDYPSLTRNDFNGLSKPVPSCGPVPQKPPRNVHGGMVTKPASKNGHLLNLSDIWQTNGTAGQPEYSKVLQEERLRRQHCERNIQSLHVKLLEYEEKIAVALSVDKEKVSIIANLEQETARLTGRLRDMEHKHIETHEKLMAENVEIKNKNLFLEKELAETLNLVRKLEDKKDNLEAKIEHLATANRDVNDVHRQQMEDLQIRLANSRDNERQLREQLGKQRKANEQLGAELQAEKQKLADSVRIRADFCALKTKTDTLGKRFAEVTRENESLQEQAKHMKEQIAVHQEESKKLLKELEIQRLSLKKYYQSQLEDVVSDKLKEFQKQLTTVEEELKEEAKKRERTLTERAKRQIELIDQKREQEMQLLTERYNEQESLYRLQLTNSAKRIHELEDKLRTIHSRRADIAEQLHSIMENQWKQALDVLMSPGQQTATNNAAHQAELDAKAAKFSRLTLEHVDKDRLDGVSSLKNSILTDENDSYRTPGGRKSLESNGNPSFPKELLHNYIELLLQKSPNDLKRLEEVLSSCRKQSEKETTVRINGNETHPGTLGVGRSASATALNQLGLAGKSSNKTPRPWK
ncbi:227 kDa spindle- and centromere-associated protein-like [Anopheles stephensi]|uniref:227 kDa spindle- and centromere-associated protein-like n=1 Tax=Anopheles stephensi TaxID=30069 RepID=UPI001658BFD7|nr:227 kDa spindle- and centromere-associated protein-like [Anopheles stephensi]